MLSARLHSLLVLSLPVVAIAYPRTHVKRVLRDRDAMPDNIVKIYDPDKYCLIMPRVPHTDIGDSEYLGGMQSFCSSSARDNDSQGLLPDNFWRNVEYQESQGHSGGKYVQLTGCIRPNTIDRLNTYDEGGQYDSSGGVQGKGNPRDSVCVGYNHYVQLVEPASNRACIRCCQDFNDCPLKGDTAGCPKVIPGNYFHCY